MAEIFWFLQENQFNIKLRYLASLFSHKVLVNLTVQQLKLIILLTRLQLFLCNDKGCNCL